MMGCQLYICLIYQMNYTKDMYGSNVFNIVVPIHCKPCTLHVI